MSSLSSGTSGNSITYIAPASVNLPSEYDYINVDTLAPNSSSTFILGNIRNSGFLGSAKKFVFTDVTGNAANSPIRIQGSLGDNINGQPAVTINTNFGTVTLFAVSNNQWSATASGGGGGGGVSLQQVLNFNHDLVNGLNFQGTGAGVGNTGMYDVIGIGNDAAKNNSGQANVFLGLRSGYNNSGALVHGLGIDTARNNTGDRIVGIGDGASLSNSGDSLIALGTNAGRYNSGDYNFIAGNGAGYQNSGSQIVAIGRLAVFNNSNYNVVGIGDNTARGNSGSNVVALGRNAAFGNSGDQVIALGFFAAESNQGSEVIAIGIDAARTAGPNADGVIAIGRNAANANGGYRVLALGDYSARGNAGNNIIAFGQQAGQFNTQSGRTIFSNLQFPAFANRAVALAAITVPLGASPNCTYQYYNQTTGAIEAVRT